MAEHEAFAPGSYWTPERARLALDQMVALRDSPEMQAMMSAVADVGVDGDPAAAAAAMLGTDAPPAAPVGAVDRAGCVFRRGRMDDVPALVPLIVAGELPPIFLEPFIDGFLIVEHSDRMVGCGGLEFYGEDALIRSVVVDEAARGLGLGIEIGRLLEQDAIESGARDIYLFTMHAWDFWKRLRYVDLPLDQWAEPMRENWQYQFMAQFPEVARDVHPMIRQR